MAAKHYCNVTTDLTDVFWQIENYNTRDEITGFVLVSGQTYTYHRRTTGYIEDLLENGAPLTAKTTIALVEATAATYWYDSTNDILYVHCTGGVAPSTKTIERCVDWLTFKTRMRNEAEDELDSMLDARYPRPLPESRRYHESTNDFDSDIKRACALLACTKIVRRQKGISEIADKLYSEVTNTDKTGIIDEHNSGKRWFSWEVSPDEQSGFEITPNTSNTGAGFIEIKGKYEDVIAALYGLPEYLPGGDCLMMVEIDGVGATGTATYKWSVDNGTTWENTTVTTDYEWASLTYGMYIRFWDRSGSFASGDKWEIKLTEGWTEESASGTIRLERA